MNPATRYWQRKISDLALYLDKHTTFSGIYSDAVTGPPQICGMSTTAEGGHATKFVKQIGEPLEVVVEAPVELLRISP